MRNGVVLAALLMPLFGCSDGTAELTDAMRATLTRHADPATWEDLDPAQPGRRRRDPRTGIVFVLVPAGEFVLGSAATADTAPPHRVVLSRPFLLAETELTAGQWRRYVREFAGDASVPAPADETLPMPLSHDDAQRFCERLGYRLPTEAEWERACRGGLPPEASVLGPRELADVAWFNTNAGDGSRPVATRQANPYGLYDMLGNLWEWCSDWYQAHAYQGRSEPVVDPKGPEHGIARVLRGGSWFTLPGPRPETRIGAAPNERNAFYGCRVARDP